MQLSITTDTVYANSSKCTPVYISRRCLRIWILRWLTLPELTRWGPTKMRTKFPNGSLVGNPNSSHRSPKKARYLLSDFSASVACVLRETDAWPGLFPEGSDTDFASIATEVSLKCVFPADLVTQAHVASLTPDLSFNWKHRKKLDKMVKIGKGWKVDIWNKDRNPWTVDEMLEKMSVKNGTSITMSKNILGGRPDSANTTALRGYIRQQGTVEANASEKSEVKPSSRNGPRSLFSGRD